MQPSLTSLTDWASKATDQDRKSLATLMGYDTPNFISQVLCRRRVVSAKLAASFELASKKLQRKRQSLPIIRREDLSPTCGSCDYAKQCKTR